MRQIRVFHLVNEFSDSSCSRLILQLINGLDRDRYRVDIGCIKRIGGPMEDLYRQAGAATVNFGMADPVALGVVPKLVSYLRSHEAHILHTHVLRPDLLGAVAARLARGTLLVSTKHNMGYVPGQEGWLLRDLFYWPAMYLPDRVIVVTEALRRQLISHLRLSPDRVLTIHSGIAIEDFCRPGARQPCRQSLGIQPGSLVVSYIGRLVEGKGLECLLRSAQRVVEQCPNAYFLVAGEGPLRPTLERLSGELGIASHLLFLGFRADIPDILAATDVSVLPSISEGLPLSLLEAMAAGKAVLASPVGGVAELVDPGRTGVLVPPGNPASLGETIATLLEDPHRRKELGSAAQSYVRTSFGIRQMVDAYDEAYQSLATIGGWTRARDTGAGWREAM